MIRKIITKLLISFILFANIAYAQFYYYSDDLRGSRAKGIVENVYRINLKTGVKELILMGVGSPIVLPEINNIVFRSIPQLEICIYHSKKGITDTLSYIGKIEGIYQIHTVPPDNHIFLELVKLDAKIIDKELKILESTNVLIDKDTYIMIDSSCYYSKASESLLSRDGKKLYILLDSSNDISFRSRNTKTNEIISEKITIEGYENVNMKYNPYFIDSKNGYIFVGYFSEIDNNLHLVLCDPENKEAISEMTFPTGVPPYAKAISKNGDLIFQDGGKIYILDGQTTKLEQRLKFTTSDNPESKSKIFILGDSLYFFPEDPEKSDAASFDNIGHADLTVIQSDISLIEMLIDDVDESYQNGWIDNQGIANSLNQKLENAKKQLEKGKAKQAINMLNAFLNEVEAQKDKHLTSEAYALLKYNAEYLIKRLEED